MFIFSREPADIILKEQSECAISMSLIGGNNFLFVSKDLREVMMSLSNKFIIFNGGKEGILELMLLFDS